MLKRRIVMSLLGVVICSVAVAIFKIAALGVDPFQSFLSGMDQLLTIQFGTLYMIVNAVLLLFALLADKRQIGIATVINLFIPGYITQFLYELLLRELPNPSIFMRVMCLAIGIVVICFGSAIYMTANLGLSSYDAVAVILSDAWKFGKFKYVRMCCDISCVTLGVIVFLIGGGHWKQISTIAGVGTVITAFFMGPLIDFFNIKIARPLLHYKINSR